MSHQQQVIDEDTLSETCGEQPLQGAGFESDFVEVFKQEKRERGKEGKSYLRARVGVRAGGWVGGWT